MFGRPRRVVVPGADAPFFDFDLDRAGVLGSAPVASWSWSCPTLLPPLPLALYLSETDVDPVEVDADAVDFLRLAADADEGDFLTPLAPPPLLLLLVGDTSGPGDGMPV